MNWKRWMWIGGFLLLLALIVATITNGPTRDRETPRPNTPGVTSPEAPSDTPPNTTPNSDPGEGEHGHDEPQRKNDSHRAVVSANEAVNALLVSQFFPDEQMAETVNLVVAPESRQEHLDAYLAKKPGERPGVILAVRWNFNSISEALAKSGLRVDTKQFKVKSFDPERGLATLALYSITTFNVKRVQPSLTASTCLYEETQTQNGNPSEAFCKYEVPGISIVKMRWVEGRWLYVGKVELGAEEMLKLSRPIEEMTTEEVQAQYELFLQDRGYKPYVG